MKRIICLIFPILMLLASSCVKEESEGSHYPIYVPRVEAVDGAYSVSAACQVQFAAGNVQYMPFFGYWRIAEEQYHIRAKANEHGSRRYSGWVDLFGWGTADDPLLRSLDTNDYAVFADWGTHFGSGWRTLTEEEWEYLLYYRPGARSLFATAVVCGVKGLMLLPDEWDCPGGISMAYGDFSYDNVFNERQIHRLQEAGAVFLPNAGFRQGESYSEGLLGYWTATTVGVRGFEGIRVFLDLTPEDSFVGLKGMSAYCGLAVRLARNI